MANERHSQIAEDFFGDGNVTIPSLGDILRELDGAEDAVVLDDGASDWAPVDLLNALDDDELNRDAYHCQDDENAAETGYIGYIARFDDAGYIQASPPMYRIYLASMRSANA